MEAEPAATQSELDSAAVAEPSTKCQGEEV